MSTESSAQRYAIAQFEMARDGEKEQSIFESAQSFLKIYEGSSDLRIAFSHPNIQKSDRRRIVEGILERSGYDVMFSNFIRVLVERGRAHLYPRIVSEYEVLMDAACGRIRAQVYVASSLQASQRAQLKSKIESQLKHEVVLQEHIEPSIIGGFRLELQGRVYDNSIRRHLERLREEMHIV